jgi:CheY-like chemotaxis protein
VAAKLLLADDSVTIQRVIELTFADENIQVVAVGDGKAAIDRVQSDRPDIVLADIGMPERDGYEVAAFIKGSPDFSHIPVLLLTGAFEPVDEDRARSIGCEGVLVKPFEPQMVINRVRELLNKRVNASQVVSSPEPTAAAKTPAPPQAAQPGTSPAPGPQVLEAYFDRLDAALATLNTSPPALEPTADARPEAGAGAPRQPIPPAPVRVAPARVAPPAAATTSRAMPSLHDAFTALLAAERGQPVHGAAPLDETFTDTTAGPPAVTEELIEQIVGRVLARMGDDTMRRAVLDTAERLVREEIERIKSIAG